MKAAKDLNDKARLVGINHVALEVDDVDAALEWYGRFFDFELRGRADAVGSGATVSLQLASQPPGAGIWVDGTSFRSVVGRTSSTQP